MNKIMTRGENSVKDDNSIPPIFSRDDKRNIGLHETSVYLRTKSEAKT